MQEQKRKRRERKAVEQSQAQAEARVRAIAAVEDTHERLLKKLQTKHGNTNASSTAWQPSKIDALSQNYRQRSRITIDD
jgi:hypothetical protein